MPLVVRDLLDMSELEGIRLLAGASGLERPVRNVNVMEAPDISRWLHGGELVLTSAYLARENPEQLLSLVNDLNAAGAAALGVKLGRFIGQLPEQVKDTADKIGLAILEIPIQLAFTDVITPILSRIINEQAGDIRFSEMVLRSFSDLLVEGGGIDQVLYNLQLFSREDVAFFSLPSRERYCSAKNEAFREDVFGLALRELQDKYLCRKIQSGDNVYGYLFLNSAPGEQKQDRQLQTAAQHAATALMLLVQRDIASREVEYRYRNEFVQDLILNNVKHERDLTRRAHRFGWDLSGWVRAIVVQIDPEKRRPDGSETPYAQLEERRQMVSSIAVEGIRRVYSKMPYSTMSDAIVFLDFSPEPPSRHIGREDLLKIQEQIAKRTEATVTIATGRFKESAFLAHESYTEAKKALEIVRSLKCGNHIIDWDELGIFSFIAPICNTPDAKNFCEEQLQPLIQHDKEHNSDLLITLEAVIKSNWQLKQAADDLSIHYNTLRYRYDKIRELLRADLNDSDKRLSLGIAFKMYRMNIFDENHRT